MPEAVGTELKFTHPVRNLAREYLSVSDAELDLLRTQEAIISAREARGLLFNYSILTHPERMATRVDALFKDQANLQLGPAANPVDLAAYMIDVGSRYLEGFEEQDLRYFLDSAVEHQIATIENRRNNNRTAFFHYGEDYMSETEMADRTEKAEQEIQALEDFQARIQALQEASSSSPAERR